MYARIRCGAPFIFGTKLKLSLIISWMIIIIIIITVFVQCCMNAHPWTLLFWYVQKERLCSMNIAFIFRYLNRMLLWLLVFASLQSNHGIWYFWPFKEPSKKNIFLMARSHSSNNSNNILSQAHHSWTFYSGWSVLFLYFLII